MGNANALAVADDSATTDKELLERAVICARWDISHGREPAPLWQEQAVMEPFWPLLDPECEEAKARIVKMAESFGLEDQDAGEFDAQMMGLVLDLAYGAFWLGLTRGDVMINGTPSLPYRLFPERSGGL